MPAPTESTAPSPATEPAVDLRPDVLYAYAELFASKPKARGARDIARIAANTTLIRGSGFGDPPWRIKLYDQVIATVDRERTIVITTGGWQTPTTLNRLRRFVEPYLCGYKIIVSRKRWYWESPPVFPDLFRRGSGMSRRRYVPFADGQRVAREVSPGADRFQQTLEYNVSDWRQAYEANTNPAAGPGYPRGYLTDGEGRDLVCLWNRAHLVTLRRTLNYSSLSEYAFDRLRFTAPRRDGPHMRVPWPPGAEEAVRSALLAPERTMPAAAPVARRRPWVSVVTDGTRYSVML